MSGSSSSGGYKASGLSASIAQEATSVPSKASGASPRGGSPAGAPGASTKSSGEAVPNASPRSTVASSTAGMRYTFALLGGDITPDDITGDTTVGDLFKKLYLKAKSENYNWSGPEIISISAQDGMIVNELQQHMYNEKLKNVFRNDTNLTIARLGLVNEGRIRVDQIDRDLSKDLKEAESAYRSFNRVLKDYKIDEVLRAGGQEEVKQYLEEQEMYQNHSHAYLIHA